MPHANAAIKVLIVDDEPSIVNFLKMGLLAKGYRVFCAYDGIEAMEKAEEIQPHLVILDLMIPGMSGYEVCRRLKENLEKVTVIMLTAKDEVDDLVKGLEIGADDYMSKPFKFKELLARIQVRLKSGFPELYGPASFGPFVIDNSAHEIYYQGQTLSLSLTEYNLLTYLVTNQGQALSKDQILDKVWGFDFGGEKNIVEVYVRYLREKLGDMDHTLIRTVRGVGYKVVLP